MLLQEEIAKLQRKLERSKKIEMAGAADEVLLAEIQEYKVSQGLFNIRLFHFFFVLNRDISSFHCVAVIICSRY